MIVTLTIEFIFKCNNNCRSCLNDCKLALKFKLQYSKALSRAVTCSFRIRDYDQCIDLCDQFLDHNPTDKTILKLKSDAVIARVRLINYIDIKVKL